MRSSLHFLMNGPMSLRSKLDPVRTPERPRLHRGNTTSYFLESLEWLVDGSDRIIPSEVIAAS